MLKTLLKKQLLELFHSFFVDQKKGVRRKTASTVLFILLYIVLIAGVLGGGFFFVATSMCAPLAAVGMDWLYFTLLGLFAIALGTFGSVFSTFSGLYQAKDNDLLLSMPIPSGYILSARLFGAYFMGLLFVAAVLVPAILAYCLIVPVTALILIGCVLLLLLSSFLVLILTCILGWIVAKINSKLKNKSFLTVLVSIAFLAIYYLFYFRASAIIQQIVENAATIGVQIRGAAYPLYLFGRVGCGDMAAAGIVSVGTLALSVLTWTVLSRTFLRMATTNTGTARIRARKADGRVRTPDAALLGKERRRFTGSPNYMLNCGMGLLMTVVAAVMLIIKQNAVREILDFLDITPEAGAVLFAGALSTLSASNDMTAASVSLEGKSLWILQSLPVEPRRVLRAKLTMQLQLVLPVNLLCSLCCAVVLRPELLCGVLMILLPVAASVLSAAFGLFLNLKRPNLTWTNEIVPIKQGFSVGMSLLLGWALGIVLTVGGMLLCGTGFPPAAFLGGCTLLMAALSVLLLRWLRSRGAAILAAL